MPELTAGPLSVVFEDAALADVRVAGRAALDRVYVAVRDADWRTIPATVLASRAIRTDAGPAAEFEVRHALGEIDFRWQGTVEATATGFRFSMDGVAQTSFEANRIGFCLLHPQALKGRPVQVRSAGRELAGTFPELISPHQLFTDVERMSYEVGGGARLEIAFGGDLFETEDHRNWSDPGWKTYCTPLSAPRPVRRLAGQRVRQVVELSGHAATIEQPPAVSWRTAGGDTARITARVTVGTTAAGTVPRLGLGASCRPATAARQAVRELRPAYLHVELEDGTDWPGRLEAAAAEAADLEVPLDVALVAPAGRVTAMAGRLARTPGSFGRISVFSPTGHVTEAGTVAALRDAGLAGPVGGGSRAHFAELNRGKLDLDTWDFVTYGLSPQVHHDDDASILTTAEAVADGLAHARVLARGRPVVAGPVTLRPRFNAAADRADPLPAADDDGPDADPRQHTRLAAVYLAAAVCGLAGADAVTVFRTVGRRGVVGADGCLSPAARVVSALAALAGAEVRETTCTGGLTVLAVAASPGLRILAANRARHRTRVELADAAATEAAVLDGEALEPTRLVLPPRSVALIEAVPA